MNAQSLRDTARTLDGTPFIKVLVNAGIIPGIKMENL